MTRYRCRTGNAYSPETLADQQARSTDTALWAALRSLQETADLSRRMAGRTAAGEDLYLKRAAQAERRAATPRAMVEPAVDD